MWVWIIATLVRDVCTHVELKKLLAARTVRDYLQKKIVPLPQPPVLATSSSIIPETQEHVLQNSPGGLPLIAPRKRTETAFLRNEKSERPQKRLKQSKIPPPPPSPSRIIECNDNVSSTLYPDSQDVEIICQLVGANRRGKQALDSMAKAKMSIPMQKFGADMTDYMADAYAEMRQPILTRQYMGLAEFPGVATATSLFYDHEFWYSETLLRPYFSKFQLVMFTEHVQVVLAPLFGIHACFHLQMLHDYVMPVDGDQWAEASNEWASKCCLDSSMVTHSFQIKNPHSKRVATVQAAIKAWAQYDAQFYLGYGIFTLAPTNVFLAINGVSPEARFVNEHEYCKMVIKKKNAIDGLRPSTMWQEFWKVNAHMVSYLDELTLKRDITGEVLAVNIPRVWAEPIPGMQSLNFSLID
jgi:hypothetical protein